MKSDIGCGPVFPRFRSGSSRHPADRNHGDQLAVSPKSASSRLNWYRHSSTFGGNKKTTNRRKSRRFDRFYRRVRTVAEARISFPSQVPEQEPALSSAHARSGKLAERRGSIRREEAEEEPVPWSKGSVPRSQSAWLPDRSRIRPCFEASSRNRETSPDPGKEGRRSNHAASEPG